jgi:ribosomal protein L11 methyltransferase
MAWLSLTLDVPDAHSELAQSLMYDFGASGLELRDGEHQVMPQVRPPLPGEAIIVAYFEDPAAAQGARDAVERRIPGTRSALAAVVERDWSTEWRSLIKSVTVGRLWVGPPWDRAQAPAGKVCLVIEPKMAFGTGDHPTTLLCLQAVDEFLASRPGSSVLDVGTGTGVLAFAARRLGAGRTVGIDTDAHSVELAKEGALENGLQPGVDLELSDAALDQVDGTFDLVLANILANTLVALAPALAKRVAGRLVLAGVLVPQAELVSRAFVAEGLVPAGQTVQGEWIRLDFDAAPPPRRRARPPASAPARARPISPVRARAQRKLQRGRSR